MLKSHEWRLFRVGDAALVIECEQRIDPDINARVLAVANTLRRLARPGVRDVVESYCGITIHFDPLITDTRVVLSDIETEMAGADQIAADDSVGQRVTIPVCYGGIYGPDLHAVAAFAKCSETEVIERHASQPYRVYMLGFLPGFAYMGSVPVALAMPRKQTPRFDVPAGSVGIAGRQTGVYPLDGPGGWQLIGRTPVTPFDLGRTDPFLFRPGDTVQFEPIQSHRFDELRSVGAQ